MKGKEPGGKHSIFLVLLPQASSLAAEVPVLFTLIHLGPVSLRMSSTMILTIPPSSWGASNQYSTLVLPRMPLLSHVWVLCSPNHLCNRIASSNLLFSLLSGFCIFFFKEPLSTKCLILHLENRYIKTGIPSDFK